MFSKTAYLAFDKSWFVKHQSKLLWLLNYPLTRRWFRFVLRIRKYDCALTTEITQIEPNQFSYGDRYFKQKGKWYVERTTDFRTHPKFAKRLYFAFRPIWWAMHLWDIAADPLIPYLSFGFSTLTVYPDTGNPGTTTCDGEIDMVDASSYAFVHDATTGTGLDSSTTNYMVVRNAKISINWWINRCPVFFDSSSLGSGAAKTAGTLSLYFDDRDDSAEADSVSIVTSSISSNTTYATSDYASFGTTKQASDIAIGSLSLPAYNDFTLNATGLGNVSLTGVTKFGLRTAQDISNTAPALRNDAYCRTADNTGTSQDPKLVVTYTVLIAPDKWHPEIQKPIFEILGVVSYMRLLISQLLKFSYGK